MLIPSDFLTLAVFPVLVGPLQTLLALLPAILLGVGSMVMAIFRPGGFVRLVRFVWRQKLFLGTVAAIVIAVPYGLPARLVQGRPANSVFDTRAGTNWDASRGSPRHLGRGPGIDDATAPGTIWTNARDKTVLSSPAITGDHILFSTATDIGPFSPEGRGAIVCVDAHSGKEVWRYAPDNHRATFSSPVVSGTSVVCGEGLHQVEDARITCLDLGTGRLRWEFRTKSHVESTPAIADGRVFVGAGSDGFYCLSLDPDSAGQPQVLWHAPAEDFADCESSPAVADGVVYFGLGEGGAAICALQAETGKLLWKLPTQFPVFAPPTIADGKLYIAAGNGNYVQSAADLLHMKLQMMKEEGSNEQQLVEARERLKPIGVVSCIDLATRNVDWTFSAGDAILGAIACTMDSLYFGSRDGNLYRLSRSGELLGKYDLHEPLISSPAIGLKHVYCTTNSGRLFCLDQSSMKPVWDVTLGIGAAFSSSPTLAHGHIYIGTAQDGLRCVGRPGAPEPAVWNQGERGGSVDGVPIPETSTDLWSYPAEDDRTFVVTAPLMILDGSLYAAGDASGQTRLVKLDLDPTPTRDRLVWSREFENRVRFAPAGCGERICIVEDCSRIHCLSTGNGKPHWSLPLVGMSAMKTWIDRDTRGAGITLDRSRVFVWTDRHFLSCFDLDDGDLNWDLTIQGHHPDIDLGRVGFGVPALSGDLVVTMHVSAAEPRKEDLPTLTRLIVQDAMTGIELWQLESADAPIAGPIVEGNEIHIPVRDGTIVRRITDGMLLRHQAAVPSDADNTRRFPTVSFGGRAYEVTDSGRIVCRGAASP